MRMYDYSEAYISLEQKLVNGEIELETYQDTIESISDGGNEKAENLGKMIDNFKAQSTILKDEADKLTAKRKSLDNKVEWLTASLETYLMALGKEQYQVGLYKLWYKKLPDVVEFTNENVIPKAYKTPQEPKIDKRSISRALKDGETVRGAKLVTNRKKFEVKK